MLKARQQTSKAQEIRPKKTTPWQVQGTMSLMNLAPRDVRAEAAKGMGETTNCSRYDLARAASPRDIGLRSHSTTRKRGCGAETSKLPCERSQKMSRMVVCMWSLA